MNERFRLNSLAIREWLDKEGRKQAFLMRALKVSRATVDRMVNHEHVPEERRVTEALAALMGVEESALLIPRQARVG